MAPKKVKKITKVDKIPEKIDKLNAVDKQFYELAIQDLNRKLGSCREHVAKLEIANHELTNKIVCLEKDYGGIIEHLERKLSEKTIEMDERVNELTKLRNQENQDSLQKIEGLELKYNDMFDQLTTENQLLSNELSSLKKFQIQKDDLLAKFDKNETEFKEHQRMHKEMILTLDRKCTLDKNYLKNNIHNELLKLSEACTKANEIRIAAYQQRLIRENISLNSEMDKIVQTEQNKDLGNKNMQRITNEFYDKRTSNEDIQKRLIKTCHNHIEIIEKLTNQYEALKERYERLKKYKHQYDMKRSISETSTLDHMKKKLHGMTQCVEMEKFENQTLISIRNQQDAEIIRLRKVLESIKVLIESDMFNRRADRYYDVQHKVLFQELFEIINDEYSGGTILLQLKYQPGDLGLIPKPDTIPVNILECGAKTIPAPKFVQEISNDNIIPTPRTPDEPNLIDVETGSLYIVSSDDDNYNNNEIPEEDIPEEEIDLGISSSSSETLPYIIPTAKGSITSLSTHTLKDDTIDDSLTQKSVRSLYLN